MKQPRPDARLARVSKQTVLWSEVSLPGCYTRLLSEWLATQSFPSQQLRTEIEAVDASARVPIARWFGWLQQASAYELDATHFLAIGGIAEKRHFGLLGHLIACHSTLGEALQAYHSFERLQYGISFGELIDTDSDQPLMLWRLPEKLAYLPAEAIALASMQSFLVKSLGISAPFTAIYFAGDGHASMSAYQEFFGCPVHFGRDIGGVAFTPDALRHPLQVNQDILHGRLTDSTLRSLNVANDADPTVSQILTLLPAYLHEGGALAPRISAELGIAPRSLHQRLSTTPWQFSDLLSSVRQQAAIYYLNAPDLSLAEVAFLLGFSEQSAFQRAFKTWFGTTPRHWRLQQAVQ